MTVRAMTFVCKPKGSLRHVASTASRLHVRDDREAPLSMRRDERKDRSDLPDDTRLWRCDMVTRRAERELAIDYGRRRPYCEVQRFVLS
ncbi:hypothetical protein SSBR45G_29370 [Bradyrhizobium sp. SSBR45G]|nr:hypothetical protein SSBR45G_29370 [Bradyrhizobium sp. SSBR45G]